MQCGRFPSYDLIISSSGSFAPFSLYLIALIALEMMSLEVFISPCSRDAVPWNILAWFTSLSCDLTSSLRLLARESYSKYLAMVTYFIVLYGTRDHSEFKFLSLLERDSITKYFQICSNFCPWQDARDLSFLKIWHSSRGTWQDANASNVLLDSRRATGANASS